MSKSNAAAVAKYREKLGIEKVREMTKNYTQKIRSNPEYKKLENEKNKERYRQKVLEKKINDLETKFETINYANKFIDELVEDTVNTIPEKRGRGRPKMTEEQKKDAKIKRTQKLINNE